MASVVVTMDAREARLFRAMDQLIQKQDKVNAKYKEAGKNSEEAGRKSKESWDKSNTSIDKMKAGLVSYAAGLGTVAAGVGLITKAWDMMLAKQEAGFNALQRTQGADRRLLQIAGGAGDFSQMRAQADQLASQFGVDRAMVREVIFAAVSENFRDAVPAIIAANQVIDPMSAAGVAGQAPALFKGMIGALEAVNLTLKAAQASRLDFEQIAKSLPQASEGGSIAKATAEETLAVLSVLASEFKSGETAADRIKMFATRAGISEEFAGQGIVAPLEKLMGMDEATRRSFLGDSQELNVAYVKMAENIDLIKQRVAEFTKEGEAFASGGGMLASQVAIANADPRSIALLNEARSGQSLEGAQATADGIWGANAKAARNVAKENLLSEGMVSQLIGEGIFGLGISSVVSTVMSSFGLDSQGAGAAGSFVSTVTGEGITGGPIGLLLAAAEQQTIAAQKLSSAADRIAASAEKSNSQSVTAGARAQAAGASN